MGSRPQLRDPTTEVLRDIKDEHGYGSIDQAICHVLRQQGYDV